MIEGKGSGNGTPADESNQLGNYIRWGVSLVGSLAGAAGVLYALGFLVVNINLMSIGVYEAGLLRERYISTGVAFLLLLAIIGVFWFYFIPMGLKRFLDRNWPQKFYKSFRSWGRALSIGSRETWGLRRIYNFFHDRGFDIFVVLLVTFGALILISLAATLLVAFIWKISTDPNDLVGAIVELSDANFRNQRLRNLLSAIPVFLWCTLVSLIFAVWRMWLNWDEIKAVLSGKYEKKPSASTTGTQRGAGEKKAASANGVEWQLLLDTLKRNWSYFFVTLLLFFALVVYARNVFTVLPAAMGGGLPTVVQFSIKKDVGLQELIQLGIPIEENSIGQELNELGVSIEENKTDQDPSELETLVEDNQPHLTSQITLIAQTGSSYIVHVPNAKLNQNVAVSVPKSHVSGIIFYPEEYFLNDEYVAYLHTQEGHEALKQNDYLTAIEKFSAATDRKDDYLPAFIGLGDTYAAQQIVDDYACERTGCIEKAIESYKNALCPTGKIQDCEVAARAIDETLNAEVSVNDETLNAEALANYKTLIAEARAIGKTLTAEALNKLSWVYALLINSQEDTEPEETELDFLKIHCPEIKVNGEDTVDYIQAVTATLECAIEVDKKSQDPRNYAEQAINEHKFHLVEPTKLRTDDKFIELLFPTMSKEEVVRRLSIEVSDMQELSQSQIETIIDHYTWAIIYRQEREHCKLFEVLNEQHQYYYLLDYRYIRDLAKRCKDMPRIYFNRAGLYLELDGKKSRQCEDGDCLGKAIEDYENAVTLESKNTTFLTSLAGAQQMDSRLEEAVNTYNKVTGGIELEEESGYALAWLGLGEVYLSQEKNLLSGPVLSD